MDPVDLDPDPDPQHGCDRVERLSEKEEMYLPIQTKAKKVVTKIKRCISVYHNCSVQLSTS